MPRYVASDVRPFESHNRSARFFNQQGSFLRTIFYIFFCIGVSDEARLLGVVALCQEPETLTSAAGGRGQARHLNFGPQAWSQARPPDRNRAPC